MEGGKSAGINILLIHDHEMVTHLHILQCRLCFILKSLPKMLYNFNRIYGIS